jgi:hypothetical protein
LAQPGEETNRAYQSYATNGDTVQQPAHACEPKTKPKIENKKTGKDPEQASVERISPVYLGEALQSASKKLSGH